MVKGLDYWLSKIPYMKQVFLVGNWLHFVRVSSVRFFWLFSLVFCFVFWLVSLVFIFIEGMRSNLLSTLFCAGNILFALGRILVYKGISVSKSPHVSVINL